MSIIRSVPGAHEHIPHSGAEDYEYKLAVDRTEAVMCAIEQGRSPLLVYGDAENAIRVAVLELIAYYQREEPEALVRAAHTSLEDLGEVLHEPVEPGTTDKQKLRATERVYYLRAQIRKYIAEQWMYQDCDGPHMQSKLPRIYTAAEEVYSSDRKLKARIADRKRIQKRRCDMT